MRITTTIRSEFARLTATRMGKISLVALMTVPIVYGGLYLWGNQDPYGNLDRVPAAVVVDDTGATVDGRTVNYGRETADSLVKNQAFGWVEVTDAQAKTGVANGTYDFSLTFPTTFSTDLGSASNDSPTTAQLKLSTDDTNSYLSTTIAKQGVTQVRAALVAQVGKSASRTLLDAVASVRTGLSDAGDGASSLADGAATASTGAASLASGTSQLASGVASLSAGLGTLNGSAATLPASASGLASGASTVSSGLSSAASAGTSLAAVSGQAAALTPAVAAQVKTALTNAGVSPADQAPILAQLQTLATEAGTSSAIAAQLSPNLAKLAGGASQVSSGAAQLSSKAPALVAGIASARAGAADLATGAASASSGAASLATGVDSLSAGSTKLRDSLADGVTKVPTTTAGERAATAAAIADPVDVAQTAITQAKNYGAGLAPFFLSLAAWIGIYALFLLVRPLSRRALTAVRRPVRTALAGWALPAALGAVQMVALFALVTLALRIDPAHPLGMLGFMILVSLTFAAIVHALNVWLGSTGQFLALLLMVIQLVVAGGTFPWQTLPAPLAALHQALPMSHAVDGLRQLLYGGSGSALAGSVATLVVWLVVALGISVLGAQKQSRYRILRELRPSPIGG